MILSYVDFGFVFKEKYNGSMMNLFVVFECDAQSYQVVYLEICCFKQLIHSWFYMAQRGLQILILSQGKMRLFWLSSFALSGKISLFLFMLHKSQNSCKIGHESNESYKSINYYGVSVNNGQISSHFLVLELCHSSMKMCFCKMTHKMILYKSQISNSCYILKSNKHVLLLV